MHLRRFAWLLVAAVLASGGPVRAADPQPYKVQIGSTHNAALNAALQDSSQLVSLRTSAPVGPFALIDRAQQDIGRLQSALGSFGYYKPQISISVDGHPLDDLTLPTLLAALPKKTNAQVNVHIDTGPLFHIGRLTIQGEVSPAALAAFKLKSGDPVRAAEVLAARQRLLTALGDEGHAYATVSEPTAYEELSAPIMNIVFTVKAGPRYLFGSIGFQGLKRARESFLRRQLRIRAGTPYSPTEVEQARAALLGLGIFTSVSTPLPAQSAVKGDRLPLIFVVVEGKRHTVGLHAEYSSDLGIIAGVTWTSVDLFGEGQDLALHANLNPNATTFGVSATRGTGYDVGAQLTRPDFLDPNQSLQFTLDALKEDLLAYEQNAGTGSVLLTHHFGTAWTLSAGISLEQEQIRQSEVLDDCAQAWPQPPGEPLTLVPPTPRACPYTLVALPLSAHIDTTGLTDPVLDPLHGMRVSLSVQPTESLFQGRTTFYIVQGTASYYFDFAQLDGSRPGRSVLALRATAGEARGASQFALPPDQRFYAGGSATVRGYAYQSVGPTFPPPDTAGEYPEGGTGLAAGSVELRQRLFGNFGMALFADIGEVTINSNPFNPSYVERVLSPQGIEQVLPAGSWSIGYGMGVRYYTPIGPIRLDLAVPVHRLPNGDAFEAYIGLGQAF